MKITDKNIVLTGASGGIGREIAKAIDLLGGKMILVGRDAQKLVDLKNILLNPERHTIVDADLAKDEGRKKLLSAAAFIPGGIHILINNAGVNNFNFLQQQKAKDIEKQIHTNLLSPILLVQDMLPLLEQTSEAAIINIGSSFGSIGFPGYTSYCASKFGLRGFSEALRRELADGHIRVMYFAPRATKTAINNEDVCSMNKALGSEMDSPQRVAELVLQSIQKNRSNTFIGWPEKLFVRINAIFPGIVDGALRKQLSTIRHFAKT